MNVFDYFFENTKDFKKEAILGNKERISYIELFKISLSLAKYIQSKWGENNNIILISYNSIFFITVYLAIFKSGNICVPVNPEIEHTNLEFIIKTCQAEIAFITSDLSNKHNLELNNIITDTELLNLSITYDTDFKTKNIPFESNRLAEIIFTSGSTGEPKGVMISHKNIIANTNSIIDYLKLTKEDVIEIVLPFYYCYGLSLLHTHLRIGGGMVLNNTFMFIGSVINDLLKYKCTGFAGVPTHFQILLRKTKSFKTIVFPNLNYVTQAGGKLHNVFIQEFIQSFPKVKFYVMYGQTEATARLSYLPPEKLHEKIGSMGKNIPGVILDIFDAEDKPVTKPGEVGEIVAKGDNIMLGYINDEKTTKNTLHNGWLHTGDLAFRDEDGYFYLTARKKEILKVGGRRISPKEIEGVIVSIPQVVDCTISGVHDELLGEAIKLTVVVSSLKDNTLTKEMIQKFCSERLAYYKIPQIIDFIDQIKIAATGKKLKKQI